MQHKTVDLLCFEEIWEFNEEQQLSPSKLSSDGSGFFISASKDVDFARTFGRKQCLQVSIS